jgi:hypothetical protein
LKQVDGVSVSHRGDLLSRVVEGEYFGVSDFGCDEEGRLADARDTVASVRVAK